MPRVSEAEKARSHERILDVASTMLRQRGMEGTSVADVMAAAGMTHGGFYRHFPSKEALAEAAIDHAVEKSLGEVEADLAGGAGRRAVQRYIELYLSDEHVAAPANGCPLAALSRDAALSGVEVRAAYGRGVERTVEVLAAGMEGTAISRRRRALSLLSMLIGAVSLGRCAGAEKRAAILLSARQGAARIMAGDK